MATRRARSGLFGQLQVSKLCAVAVGVLVGVVELVALRDEPAVLLTVVGLALAGVVTFEAAAAIAGVEETVDQTGAEPVGYQAIQAVEAAVAFCVLGGLFVWFGGTTGDGRDPVGWLALLAAGMVAVSLVRATVALGYSNR